MESIEEINQHRGATTARGTFWRRRIRRGARVAAIRLKLARADRRSRCRLRKALPEPGFGQIKQARGLRQFLLRGQPKVRGGWSLICTGHNLLKLAKAIGIIKS